MPHLEPTYLRYIYGHSSLENIHRHPTSHPSLKLFEKKKETEVFPFFKIVESTDLYSNPFLEDLEQLNGVLKRGFTILSLTWREVDVTLCCACGKALLLKCF